MAKKRENLKDKIEELSEKKRVAVAITLSLLLLVGVYFFITLIVDVTKPIEISREEYNVLLSRLDRLEWRIKKGDESKLGSPLYIKSEKSGPSLLLRVGRDGGEERYHFRYSNRRIMGFINSKLYTLSVSSNSGTNYAITLISDSDRIVLYEE